MVVALAFGGFASWTALWCLPVSLLIGLAFATPVTALSSRLENDTGFNVLFRLVQTPLMLFSGTFFPISQLPPGCSRSLGSRRSGTASRRSAPWPSVPAASPASSATSPRSWGSPRSGGSSPSAA